MQLLEPPLQREVVRLAHDFPPVPPDACPRRPDDNGKVQTVFVTEVFGLIRSISTFRVTGGNRDYLIVGSDSGKIVILEYSTEKNCFEKVKPTSFCCAACVLSLPCCCSMRSMIADPSRISLPQ